MNELFTLADVTHESPRLAWIKRHGIVTYLSCPTDPELRLWMAGFAKWADGFSGMTTKPGHADFEADLFFHETSHNGESRMGYGDTEHEAITSLARRWGLHLWNEEEFANHQAQKRDSKNHE